MSKMGSTDLQNHWMHIGRAKPLGQGVAQNAVSRWHNANLFPGRISFSRYDQNQTQPARVA